MAKYVTQFGKFFFVIRQTHGYDRGLIFNGTPITDAEWKKLFYSSDKRQKYDSVRGSFTDYRMEGNACEIIGRDVRTITAK